MLLDTLGSTLLENILASKGVNRAGEGVNGIEFNRAVHNS